MKRFITLLFFALLYTSPVFSQLLVSRIIKDNLWGYIDTTGNEIIPPIYKAAQNFSEGLAAVRMNNEWGYIDSSGNVVIELQFKRAEPFNCGLARVMLKDKWGYINKSGTFVIEEKFDWAKNFSEGLALVKYNEKFGFIDLTGKFAINPEYLAAKSFSNGLAAVKIGGQWGYISTQGLRLIDPIFQNADRFVNGYAKVRTNKRIGFINTQGDFLEDIELNLPNSLTSFLEFGNVSEGTVTFLDMNNSRYGIMKLDGTKLIPAQYVKIKKFSEGLAPALDSTGKWGYINKNNEIVIDFQFRYTEGFVNGFARTPKGHKWGCIDKQGNWRIQPIYGEFKGFHYTNIKSDESESETEE